jgi:predicted transposase YbfD/YdcC
LRSWPAALRDLSGGASGAIAGKTLRQALDRAAAKAAIHLVRAWANSNRLGMGQVTVEDQSTDSTALPQLLTLVDCTGATVTSEAMGGQQASATGRTEHGADDVLALKKNHNSLYDAVTRCRDTARAKECAGTDHAYDATVDGAPGRIAIRKSWLLSEIDW